MKQDPTFAKATAGRQKIITTLVGLGNPGDEYAKSRHSVGRQLLLNLVDQPPAESVFSSWKSDMKAKATVAEGKIIKRKFKVILPENFMNNSGFSLKSFFKSKAEVAGLLVIHDDLDLPLGSIKISFGRGAGGHRGVESIIATLKTKDFARLRIGISPVTPGGLPALPTGQAGGKAGKLKKPTADRIPDFVLADFKPAEQENLKRALKRARAAVELGVTEGLAAAMNFGNQK